MRKTLNLNVMNTKTFNVDDTNNSINEFSISEEEKEKENFSKIQDLMRNFNSIQRKPIISYKNNVIAKAKRKNNFAHNEEHIYADGQKMKKENDHFERVQKELVENYKIENENQKKEEVNHKIVENGHIVFTENKVTMENCTKEQCKLNIRENKQEEEKQQQTRKLNQIPKYQIGRRKPTRPKKY